MRWSLWLFSLLCPALAVCAGDSSFSFDALSPSPYSEAYLGNGAIGCETTPLGTAASHCFVAGVYDHTPGDVPRLASAPAWNEINIFNGSHWLNRDGPLPTLEHYHQTLDMYDGVLRTSYVWSEDDRRIRVEAEEFVSRDNASVAATRVFVTPEFSGPIQIRLPLRNWPPPHRYLLERVEKLDPAAQKNPWLIWYPGQLEVTAVEATSSAAGALLSLTAQAPGNGPVIQETVACQWDAPATAKTHKKSESAETVLSFNAKSGTRYSFAKYAVIAPAAAQNAAAARQTGWPALLAASTSAWHNVWQSDILVEGDPNLQRAIHSMLFYLLGSARAGVSLSIPPMGLSNAGYYGHIFWDADTFLFPPLLILHPEMARSMVEFRSRTRDAAQKNAEQNGFQGAMYPWEAGPDGAEVTPRFAGQNAKYENHINGDVALAAWQYWLATGDRKWLEHDCWPILRDTADFWVSRVTFNSKQNRYEIGHVVGVNESLIGISNDAYTNAVAKKNLELAIAGAREMHVAPHPKWQEVSSKMYIPESDSALLWFPLGLPFSRDQTQSAINKMQQDRQPGAMMGGEFYPILAAQLGDRQLIGQLLTPLYAPYLRPPFNVVAETPDNQNRNFITGAGAFLQQFIFGYTGLRLGDRGLDRKFRPVLPPGITRLTLKNITVRGKRESLSFDSPAK